MVVVDPGEELLCLRELGGGERQFPFLEPHQELGKPRAHLGPILDRGAHVAEHALDTP